MSEVYAGEAIKGGHLLRYKVYIEDTQSSTRNKQFIFECTLKVR